MCNLSLNFFNFVKVTTLTRERQKYITYWKFPNKTKQNLISSILETSTNV